MEGAERPLTSRARRSLNRQLRFGTASPPTNELGDPLLDKNSAEPLGQLQNGPAAIKDGHERGVSTAEQVAADLNNETRDGMSVEAGLASMDPHGHCTKDDITAAYHAAINNGVSNIDAAAAVAADGVKNNVSAAKELVEVAVGEKTDEVGFSSGVTTSPAASKVEPEGGGRDDTREQAGVVVPVRLDESGAFWRSPECNGMVSDPVHTPPSEQAAIGSGGLLGGMLNMAITISTVIVPKATPHVAQKVGHAMQWLSQQFCAGAGVQTKHKKRRKKRRKDRGESAPPPTDSQEEVASDSEGELGIEEAELKALFPEAAGGGGVTSSKDDIKDTVLEPAKETGEEAGAKGAVTEDKAAIMVRLVKNFLDKSNAHKVKRDAFLHGGVDDEDFGMGDSAAAAHMLLCIIDPARRMSPTSWEKYAQAALEGGEGGADEEGWSSADESDLLCPEEWESYAQVALEGGEGDAEEEGRSWREILDLVVAMVCDGATGVCEMLQDAAATLESEFWRTIDRIDMAMGNGMYYKEEVPSCVYHVHNVAGSTDGRWTMNDWDEWWGYTTFGW